MVFGFLNVYKPRGITSHDVVSVLRKVTKVRQIGHSGTLDPFAEGVLAIAIGKATRLIEYLNDDKEYVAEVSFGRATDTYDIDGKTVFESDKRITKKNLENVIEHYRGEISQLPPIYSAIKVNGKKLYEYARKGEDVKIEPRKVTIFKLEIKDFNEEKQIANILIKCSKGTYIRSLAHDIGKELECGAYLSRLIRTQAGKLRIENSTELEKLNSINEVTTRLLNPIELLDLQENEITEEEQKKVLVGNSIKNNNEFKNDEIIILTYKKQLSAIAQVCDDEIKVKKGFN
ncbi:tRNA pseudouridine(55) synthase TruB [bacterium]|nr:tRNA pseudouridine(55) synthase TruB [bacterium]